MVQDIPRFRGAFVCDRCFVVSLCCGSRRPFFDMVGALNRGRPFVMGAIYGFPGVPQGTQEISDVDGLVGPVQWFPGLVGVFYLWHFELGNSGWISEELQVC